MSSTPEPVSRDPDAIFNEMLPHIQRHIEARRHKWTLTTLEWADVSSMLLDHVYRKLGLFDPARGRFEHWLNRLISHRWTNILRDNLYRYVKPCIRDGGCVYNLGGDHCAYTTNGVQCSLCPLYAAWKTKKEPEYNVRASLALDNHAQEVSNIQGDFLDIEAAKQAIDAAMLRRLGGWDRKVYRFLFQLHLTPQQASVELAKAAKKRKRALGPDDAVDYQSVLRVQKMMKAAMLQLIRDLDLG